MQRNALGKFMRFLREQRGLPEPARPLPDVARFQVGIPAWVLVQIDRLQHQLQGHWRQARLHQQIRNFWSQHTAFWRWLFATTPIVGWHELHRQHLLDCVDALLVMGYSASTINQALRNLGMLFNVLREQDIALARGLLRLPVIKEPKRLPRFLSDAQVLALRDDFEARVVQAGTDAHRRDALLDRAAFYLLWHTGLRLGELEELHLEDLALSAQKLTIRQGKGAKDRVVYLTATAVSAVQAYLAQRGPSPRPHVFLYRHKPLNKDLVRARLKAAGERCGVAVSPHRLRHTCATQLLNAGCKITSIQRLLGHSEIGTTLGYARVHDANLAADYHAAMEKVEGVTRTPLVQTELRSYVSEREALIAALSKPRVPILEQQQILQKLNSLLTTEP
jgi:site-specific recombinase XerD